MTSGKTVPNLVLRDIAGLICVLIFAVTLVVAAFITHAGPFILIGVLVMVIFGLLRFFRESGREAEAKEVAKALRSRLRKGETLLAYTVGDRRRAKPLTAVMDLALMMFTQGLAANGSGAIAVDDTFIGLTDRRLIAIERQKRPVGVKRSWRERLNLRRFDSSKGKHAVVFEAPCEGLNLSVRLAVFYLARFSVQTPDGRGLSVGLNSRYWAERAIELSRAVGEVMGNCRVESSIIH
jgi:hypothetical protein